MFKKSLTFDDVALVPQYSDIKSRTEPSLETWLTKDLKMNIPILAANMESVISDDLADILISNGSFPIFHRFTNIEHIKTWIKKYGNKAFYSWGINDFEGLKELIDYGAEQITLDVAHGHSLMMCKFIDKIKKYNNNCKIISGNVCTTLGYQDLCSAGADCVKIGIGPGSACTTRIKTGFGVSQFTAIYECGQLAKKYHIPICADGGIRSSGDIVKALAAGASSVMIGNLFSKVEESSAKKRGIGEERVVIYKGQASKEFQDEFYGGLKDKTCAEGIAFEMKVSGPAQKLIDQLLGGIRSGLTYGGARNIKELQRKAEFVEVTPSYIIESNPRTD